MGWDELVSGVTQSVGAGLQSDRQNKKNRELAQEQNKWAKESELETWKRETEYNSPLAQKQRFIEAGLNPNLIYGTGGATISGNTHASAAPVTQGEYTSSNPISAGFEGLFNYLTAEKMGIENDLKDYQSKLLQEQIQHERLKADAQHGENIANNVYTATPIAKNTNLHKMISTVLSNAQNSLFGEKRDTKYREVKKMKTNSKSLQRAIQNLRKAPIKQNNRNFARANKVKSLNNKTNYRGTSIL